MKAKAPVLYCSTGYIQMKIVIIKVMSAAITRARFFGKVLSSSLSGTSMISDQYPYQIKGNWNAR
jgi:hypothetical protein